MSNFFDHLFVRRSEDADRRAKFAAKPLPTHRLVIYFTPRSGSSWLTDVIRQSRRLGNGNEIFNPGFVANIADGIQALDKADYLAQVQRRFSSGNRRFSFEITAHQLDRLFPDASDFMDVFNAPDCRAMWLIRRDIVAQAVSLAKMVATQVAHTPHASEDERAEAERAFAYDPEVIRRWLLHIRSAECRSEELFAAFGIKPLRISYEDMLAAGPAAIRSRIAALLDVPDRDWPEIRPTHEKLGTAQNIAFAARFRADDPGLVAEVEADRAGMLDRLSPFGDA